MRFDELLLRVPSSAGGDSHAEPEEFRVRFHEHLTVLAGVSGLERDALIKAVVGTLTGETEGATMRATDHTGRPVELHPSAGVVRARFTDDDSPAPPPIDWLAPDADSLRSLLVVGADDLRSSVSSEERDDDPPELAEARATLRTLSAQLSAAADSYQRVEELQARLDDLDARIRAAEGDAARREYAKTLAELERVRAEAAALQSGVHGAETDRHLLAAADEAHRLSERWHELAAATALARAGAEAVADAGLEPPDVARLIDVPEDPPVDLPFLVAELVRTADHVAALEERLRAVASANLPEPEDRRILQLATADQRELWDTHARTVEAAEAVLVEQMALGGLGAGGDRTADIDELEAAHAELQGLQEELQERTRPVLAGAGLAALFGLLLLTASPLLAAVLFAAAAGVAYVGFVKPWRARAEAARREDEACLRIGVPTYLAFHLRRVDATLDPRSLDRLALAQAELSAAERAWAAIGGGIDLVDAATLRPKVEAYASALAAQHGAVQEVAELRRTLDELAVPDHLAAREKVLLAVDSYGIGPADIEALEPSLVAGFVDRQIALGRAARLQRTLQDAEADEEKVANRLDELLSRLGFTDGALEARVGAMDWAVERAREREAARVAARPREAVEQDLHRLNAEVRRLRRPEWTEVTATEASGPGVEELEAQRAELAAELTAVKEAARAASGVDLERLADRHAAVERRVNALEVQLRGVRGDRADVEELQQYLLAALTRANHVGPRGEPVPVLLDDPFVRVPAEHKWELMDMLRRLSEKTQLFYLTDDPFIGAWARRRADLGEISLLEPID